MKLKSWIGVVALGLTVTATGSILLVRQHFRSDSFKASTERRIETLARDLRMPMTASIDRIEPRGLLGFEAIGLRLTPPAATEPLPLDLRLFVRPESRAAFSGEGLIVTLSLSNAEHGHGSMSVIIPYSKLLSTEPGETQVATIAADLKKLPVGILLSHLLKPESPSADRFKATQGQVTLGLRYARGAAEPDGTRRPFANLDIHLDQPSWHTGNPYFPIVRFASVSAGLWLDGNELKLKTPLRLGTDIVLIEVTGKFGPPTQPGGAVAADLVAIMRGPPMILAWINQALGCPKAGPAAAIHLSGPLDALGCLSSEQNLR